MTHMNLLEPRRLMSGVGGPSAEEQYLIELVNRARANPKAEIARLEASTNADIQLGFSFFKVNQKVLNKIFADATTPAAPLGYSPILGATTAAHNALMVASEDQAYTIGDEPTVGGRIAAAGYDPSAPTSENVYAHGHNTEEIEATWVVSWASVKNGLANPAYGREAIFNPAYREVGVSLLPPKDGGTFGPVVATMDVASGNSAAPLLTGVAYHDDVVHDGFYSPGEGVGGLAITAVRGSDGKSFTGTTLDAGGYALAVEPGTYTVSIDGHEVSGVVVGSDNVKVDLIDGVAEVTSAASTPGVDLSITAKPPTTIAPGKPAKVTGKITNGTVAVNGPETVTVYVSADQTVDSGDFALPPVSLSNALDSGKSANFSIDASAASGAVPGGSYYLLTKVTVPGDTNPANDVAVSGPIPISAAATDLVPTLSGKPKLAKDGSLPLKLKIKNAGTAAASGTTDIVVSLRPSSGGSDIPAGTFSAVPISAKPKGTVSIAETLDLKSVPAGSYALVVTLVPSLSVAESNTADDTALSPPFALG